MKSHKNIEILVNVGYHLNETTTFNTNSYIHTLLHTLVSSVFIAGVFGRRAAIISGTIKYLEYCRQFTLL